MELQDSFSKYVIFETGGKQYQGIEGKTVSVEKLEGNPGDIIEIKEVLLKKNNEIVEIGKPYIGTSIKASIVKHMQAPKIVVFKFKRRKKSRVKKGHRQPQTIIRIESI
ncbi:50S ribosomal protein L21 [Candidatus Dependentiae bacterium]|nr:50S ribosomal protein L21 [Candidatus Dependentiae bacterium]